MSLNEDSNVCKQVGQISRNYIEKKCNYCKEQGHFKKNCKILKAKEERTKKIKRNLKNHFLYYFLQLQQYLYLK